MSELVKNAALLLLAVVLNFQIHCCNLGNGHRAPQLKISGEVILQGNKTNEFYKVELIKNDIVVDSLEINDKKDFNFLLTSNDYYSIRISKKGFISKVISIDTKISEQSASKNEYQFYFEAKLIGEDKLQKLNKEVLDLPIALISFDEKKDIFTYNKKYTANIKRRMYTRETGLS